jgi:Coenzyme PQQ synthesis protein D (PqqD)
MTDAPRLCASPDVVHRRIEDESVLVHLKTNKIYTLNETGSRLWELLLDGHDSEGIKRELQREYDAKPEEIDDEVDRLLASLAAEQLVSPEEAE